MHKYFTILKREYAQIVKKKSFVIGIFLTPVLMAGFMIVPALVADKDVSHAETVAILDQSGLHVGQKFSESLAEYTLEDTEDPSYDVIGLEVVGAQDSAGFDRVYDSLLMEVSEKIVKYMVVIKSEPHVGDSGLILVSNSDNFRSARRFEHQFWKLMSIEKLRESEVNIPVDSVLELTASVKMIKRDTTGNAIPFVVKMFTALVFVMIMYMMIVMYGTTLMRSVIEEKNSRIMEVLVSSVSPFQLMLGKVMGMGGAALTQVSVWIVLGLVMYLSAGALSMSLDSSLARIIFNPLIVVSFSFFFVVGYILYSALFALIGSIVNSEKEAQNYIFPITISLIIPVMVSTPIAMDPYAPWVIAMTYFPLFTPTMMLMRILYIAPTVTEYSLFSGILGEAILGFITLTLSTVAVVWLSARIFRVGILMYGKRPTLPEIIKWIKY